jgi:hypothetical protein
MKLSMSYAPVWAECAAAPRMKRFPKSDETRRREGVFCHALTEQLIATGKTGNHAEILDFGRKKLASHITEGLNPTDEHVDICAEAALYCRTLAKENLSFREKPVFLRLGETDFNGRTDFITFDPKINTLHVVDLKFGHSPVSAARNWQLTMCASAAINMPDFAVFCDRAIRYAEMHIIQPRDYVSKTPHKQWRVSIPELKFLELELTEKLGRVFSEKPVATTGTHCRYCDSKEYCKPYLERAVSLAERICDDINAVPALHLGDIYEYLGYALETLRKTHTALESRMFHEIEKGNLVGDWVVGTSKPRTAWTDDIERIRTTGQMLGVDLIEGKPRALSRVKNLKSLQPYLKHLTVTKPGKKILKKFNQREIKEIFNDE